MKYRNLASCLTVTIVMLTAQHLFAVTLATATYDNDSYMFVGTDKRSEPGITVTEDDSLGVLGPSNTHSTFAVIKFGDLSGITPKATGGGEKFLKLSVATLPGPAKIGVSIAQKDIDSDVDGYPAPAFPGNPYNSGHGSTPHVDRLEWYINNIKGDDEAHGGYAGGAPHIGVLEVPTIRDYYLNVTSAVDAWLDGSQPNHGFGLWGIDVPGQQGNTFDFISIDSPLGKGPELVSSISTQTINEPGDASGDGIVNRLDLAQVVGRFGLDGSASWSDGDFDEDRRVTLADLATLQQNITNASTTSPAPVPEPTSILIAMTAIFGLLGRRRRRFRD